MLVCIISVLVTILLLALLSLSFHKWITDLEYKFYGERKDQK
jgi:hypothetical protein